MQGASRSLTAGGGVSSPFSPIDVTTFTEPELRAAVEAAENWGTYVAACSRRLQSRGPRRWREVYRTRHADGRRYRQTDRREGHLAGQQPPRRPEDGFPKVQSRAKADEIWLA
jgi:hypothetical protein